VTKRVSDLNRRAARVGTEIMQRNAETVQHALQFGEKMAAQMTERSVDHFGRALGLTGESAHKAAEQSSSNMDAILQSSTVLAEVTGKMLREWFNFAPERMARNLACLDN
jgi:hypothetical protein